MGSSSKKKVEDLNKNSLSSVNQNLTQKAKDLTFQVFANSSSMDPFETVFANYENGQIKSSGVQKHSEIRSQYKHPKMSKLKSSSLTSGPESPTVKSHLLGN